MFLAKPITLNYAVIYQGIKSPDLVESFFWQE